MSAVVPFPGQTSLWIDGDRISIGLAGAGLSPGTRVSTKIDGKVGKELLSLVLDTQLTTVRQTLHGLDLHVEGTQLTLSHTTGTVRMNPSRTGSEIKIAPVLLNNDARTVLYWAWAIDQTLRAVGWNKKFWHCNDDLLHEMLGSVQRGDIVVENDRLVFPAFGHAEVHVTDTHDDRFAFVITSTTDESIAAAMHCRELFGSSAPIYVDALISAERAEELMVEQVKLLGDVGASLLEDTHLLGEDLEITAVVSIENSHIDIYLGDRQFECILSTHASAARIRVSRACTRGEWSMAQESDRQLAEQILRSVLSRGGRNITTVDIVRPAPVIPSLDDLNLPKRDPEVVQMLSQLGFGELSMVTGQAQQVPGALDVLIEHARSQGLTIELKPIEEQQ